MLTPYTSYIDETIRLDNARYNEFIRDREAAADRGANSAKGLSYTSDVRSASGFSNLASSLSTAGTPGSSPPHIAHAAEELPVSFYARSQGSAPSLPSLNTFLTQFTQSQAR